MWYNAENCDNTQPSSIDTTSSKIYNYIRKDFVEIAETEDKPAHWAWQEQKIKKEDWAIYSQIIAHEISLTDIELAMCDLYNMITGG